MTAHRGHWSTNCLEYALREFNINKDIAIYYNGDHVICINGVIIYDNITMLDHTWVENQSIPFLDITTYGLDHLIKSFNITNQYVVDILKQYFYLRVGNKMSELSVQEKLKQLRDQYPGTTIPVGGQIGGHVPAPRNEDSVNNPSHYGGIGNVYETVKVIIAWGLTNDYFLGNVVKYISRAGKKDPTKYLEDLKKAQWYLNKRIEMLEDQKLAEQRLQKLVPGESDPRD